MKIVTLTGTDLADYQVETSLQKFGFKLITASEEGIPAILNAVKISVSRLRKTGKAVQIIYNMSLYELMEIGAMNEGGIRFAAPEFGVFTAIGTFDLSEFGTLKLGDDILVLNVIGLTGTDKLDVFAIEGDEYTNVCSVYEPLFINASTPKEIETAECLSVIFPVLDFEKVTLTYFDGRTVSYSTDELQMIMTDINDVVQTSSKGAIVTGYLNLFQLNVETVERIVISYTANSKMYLRKII